MHPEVRVPLEDRIRVAPARVRLFMLPEIPERDDVDGAHHAPRRLRLSAARRAHPRPKLGHVLKLVQKRILSALKRAMNTASWMPRIVPMV